uniref:Uncharacterized protein n=1 Tax=Hyaloperonospora arabidopsidis (strain Emoy2) TaxID=559515 RepID=M4B3W6_HYAAE
MTMNALLGELHMVKVLHQHSGVCPFAHQWKYNPQAHAKVSTRLSCQLSSSRTRLEVEGLEVVQVHFDPSQTDNKDRQGPISFMPVNT